MDTSTVDTGIRSGKMGLRTAVSCALAGLYFASPSAHAFCTEFDIASIGVNCTDEGHKKVTAYLRPVIRPEIWSSIWLGNFAQDNPFADFAKDGQRHFESCRFVPAPYTVANIPLVAPGSINYIRDTYRNAVSLLDPANPDPIEAADRFGKLLHTVQDFYAHTNWINLLNLTGSAPITTADLFDTSLGEWPTLDWLAPVRDDIILGQIPANGLLPPGWSVSQSLTSETPIFTTPNGPRRGIITGWNENGACPDVRPGTTIDERSHIVVDPVTKEPVILPRTLRLVHGTSEVAGVYGGPLGIAFQPDRPCRDSEPTYVCIQKDTPGRPDYKQAIKLAELQTAHEWCRLLHLTKDTQGFPGTSVLMTYWTQAHDEPDGPHPLTTACGTPPEVLTGKPGPIEIKVSPRTISVVPLPQMPLGTRSFTFTLYTGDFRRSITRQYQTLASETSLATNDTVTMCVKPTDTVVASIAGFDSNNNLNEPVQLDSNDRLLKGQTLVLSGPGFQAVPQGPTPMVSANFLVTVEGDDPDNDGLSACGEQYYGTSPADADTDDDGLSDGAEANTHHTDPLDADTDDDGLTDGDEINTYGTNPLDTDSDDDGLNDGDEIRTYGTNPANPDSDGDTLKDGDEVNKYKTDPNDTDTDDDQLPDGLEVKYGTNPLLRDSDGDGLPDGKDVEWIQGAIAAIPDAAIKSPSGGNRNAMLNLLNDAEALLLKGNRKAAMDKLMTLRSRIDGCGVVCDTNDWILNCTIQKQIRTLVDLLIANAKT